MRRFYYLIVLILLLGLFVGCKKEGEKKELLRSDGYVGQNMEIVKKVNRTPAKIGNEGLEEYPVYNQKFEREDLKEAVMAENEALIASDTTYDSLDQQGNLYLNGEKTGKKLYKHSASIGLYGGDVSDKEKAVEKKITIQPRPLGNYITGLYAVAGEVIEIEISEEDLEKTGGFSIEIGNVSNRGHYNTIPLDRDFTRMPNIINKIKVNSTVTYAGSFFGGPIYLGEPVNKGSSYTVTIRGAVPYSYFILGQTTKEEFEQTKDSTAPFFDLEVWDDGVRHSGPKYAVSSYSYEQLYEVARLWEKIASISNRVPSASADAGIAMRYDTYVPAGAAVAFVGANFCVLPISWMTGSLNYEQIIESGMWGTIHEFNHHYQSYGAPEGGEVCNNAVSLLEYALYTNISSNRTEDKNSLKDWNRFTNPAVALEEVLNYDEEQPNYTLAPYAVLIHSFGVDTFLKAISLQKKSADADSWYVAFSRASGYDLTYFFETLCKFPLSTEAKETVQNEQYKPFIPVASVYQTKLDFVDMRETVRPFEIGYKETKEMDFSQMIIVPEGMSYTVDSVTDPENGKITKEGLKFIYQPNAYQSKADTFEVEITIDSKVKVGITVSLKQKPNSVEVTTYSYSKENMYSNIAVAEANSFAGYADKKESIHSNMTIFDRKNQTITILKTKIHLQDSGFYRFYLRGRDNVFLYVSFDKGKTYHLAMYINGVQNNFSNDITNSFYDFEIAKAQDVYIKEIILAKTDMGFAELGYSKKLGNESYSASSIPDSWILNPKSNIGEEKFCPDNAYPKLYTTTGTTVAYENMKVVDSENFNPYSKDYTLEKMLDGNRNTYMHTNNAITESNAVTIVLDLSKIEQINYLKIFGKNNKNESHVPITFSLYFGKERNELEFYKEYCNLEEEDTYIQILLEENISVRYVKLVISDTQSHRYLAISRIDMGKWFPSSTLVSMTNDKVQMTNGIIEESDTIGKFGYVVCSKNSTITYSFTGTRIAIFGYAKKDSDFSVQIDSGKWINLKCLKSEELNILFSNIDLENGNHTIKIKCKNKNVKFSCFANG